MNTLANTNKTSLDEKRAQLEKEFAKTILDYFEKGEIDLGQMQPLARIILDLLRGAQTEDELKDALKTICSDYPYFDDIYKKYCLIEEEEHKEEKEKEILKKLASFVADDESSKQLSN